MAESWKKLRHHVMVLLRNFWSANTYFFKNLIASQQISTSTHFLPCLTASKVKIWKIKNKGPLAHTYVPVEYLLYSHQHFFNSENTLTPTQLIWKLKVTCMLPALSLTISLLINITQYSKSQDETLLTN